MDGAVIPKSPDVIHARRGHRDKLRLYVQRRDFRLAHRCNRSRKACCRHRGRHGCAAARCSGGWPNLSRICYDRLLLLFVMMTLLASFSPKSTPPVKKSGTLGNSTNMWRGCLHSHWQRAKVFKAPQMAIYDGVEKWRRVGMGTPFEFHCRRQSIPRTP